jgi:hypothetical protein
MTSSAEIKVPPTKDVYARLSYARDLFTPRVVVDKNEPPPATEAEKKKKLKYGATFIFRKSDKESRAALEKLALETIKAEWPEKGVEWLGKKMIKTPFFDGEGPEAHNKTTGELHAGMGPDVWFIRVSANYDRPPSVVGRNPNIQAKNVHSPDGVYSGCWGKVVLNAFTTDHPTGGKRLSFGVIGFQKHQEGEPLGGEGSVDLSKHFETIADEGPAPESTKTGAGASSLFD